MDPGIMPDEFNPKFSSYFPYQSGEVESEQEKDAFAQPSPDTSSSESMEGSNPQMLGN